MSGAVHLGRKRTMRKPASTSYKGLKIEFVKMSGKVWARAPAWTRQYIGVGKTKAEALADAKKAIDAHYDPKANRRTD